MVSTDLIQVTKSKTSIAFKNSPKEIVAIQIFTVKVMYIWNMKPIVAQRINAQ